MNSTPVPHCVFDRAEGTVLGTFPSHEDATHVCWGLEPVPTREDGWRYVIEPVQEVGP